MMILMMIIDWARVLVCETWMTRTFHGHCCSWFTFSLSYTPLSYLKPKTKRCFTRSKVVFLVWMHWPDRASRLESTTLCANVLYAVVLQKFCYLDIAKLQPHIICCIHSRTNSTDEHERRLARLHSRTELVKELVWFWCSSSITESALFNPVGNIYNGRWK